MKGREIEFNGDMHPVRFTMAGMEEYTDLTGTPLEKVREEMIPTKLFYIGLKWGAKRERKPFNLTPVDADEIFEEKGIIGLELLMWLDEDLTAYAEAAKKKMEQLLQEAEKKAKGNGKAIQKSNK